MRFGYWKPYVPVAQRRAEAKLKIEKLRKKGLDVQPIEIQGRKIAKSFWGAAWCDHLESFGDFANRIPRGRTYVRNGSVCHLAIEKGKVTAMVSGSELYKVEVDIDTLAAKRWKDVKKNCTGQVSSVLELLQGKLSESVMGIVTDQKTGLFPTPREIRFSCDCPDYASMCKHIAAVLYGVGAKLDHQPELLFTLRAVDHQELITADVAVADSTPKKGGRRRIASDALGDVFGIDIADDTPEPHRPAARAKKAAKKAAKKTARKAAKKTTKKAAKKTAKKKAGKKAPRPRNAKGELIFTGPDVVGLRKKFGMSEIEFAYIAGVTPLTVQNWENKPGGLTLRKNSRESLEEIVKLTKRKAWQALSDITGF